MNNGKLTVTNTAVSYDISASTTITDINGKKNSGILVFTTIAE